jgi:hypothetical protein
MTEKNKLETPINVRLFKWAAKQVVGLGSSYVVKQAVNALVNPENRLQKTLVYAGSWGIGGVVAKQTSAHTEEAVDELVSMWQANRKALTEAADKKTEENINTL